MGGAGKGGGGPGYLVCGATAGAVSRSFTAPLERVKVLLQVQDLGTGGGARYEGVSGSLRRIWAEEGWRGMFRGNGTNVLRVAPSAAVRFSTFELFKKRLLALAGTPKLSAAGNLTAGCAAGLVSTVATYPLDMLRSRLSVQSRSAVRYAGLGDAVRTVYRTEGARAFFRGVSTSVHGAVPYVGINFMAYEFLKARVLERRGAEAGEPPGKLASLACGGVAGSAAMTVTYPLELVRRRMMVQGVLIGTEGSRPYTGTVDATRRIWAAEGFRGFFRGLWPNYFKVIPSMGIGFMTYEACKAWLGLD